MIVEFVVNNKSLFSDKSFSIYSKLEYKFKDRSRYKEKSKSKKDNRVYRKIEEGSQESRGSTEESTERDETTSK